MYIFESIERIFSIRVNFVTMEDEEIKNCHLVREMEGDFDF
jgi:hypothetical protein